MGWGRGEHGAHVTDADRQWGRAHIEALGPYRFLAVIKTQHGDHHELTALSPQAAVDRIRDFAERNHIDVERVECPRELNGVNCGGDPDQIERIRAALTKRNQTRKA